MSAGPACRRSSMRLPRSAIAPTLTMPIKAEHLAQEGTPSRTVAPVRGRLRHDAGDDVCGAGVSGRWRHDAGYRGPDALGQPDPHAAGGVVFGGAVFPARGARLAHAPHRHGCAGGAGHRRRLCRQPVGYADRCGRGLFRFGHHVCVPAAGRSLSGNDGAPEGCTRDRGHQSCAAGAGFSRGGPSHSGRRACCCGRAGGGRCAAGQAGRARAERRRSAGGAWQCGRVTAQRREPAAPQAAGCGAGGRQLSMAAASCLCA